MMMVKLKLCMSCSNWLSQVHETLVPKLWLLVISMHASVACDRCFPCRKYTDVSARNWVVGPHWSKSPSCSSWETTQLRPGHLRGHPAIPNTQLKWNRIWKYHLQPQIQQSRQSVLHFNAETFTFHFGAPLAHGPLQNPSEKSGTENTPLSHAPINWEFVTDVQFASDTATLAEIQALYDPHNVFRNAMVQECGPQFVPIHSVESFWQVQADDPHGHVDSEKFINNQICSYQAFFQATVGTKPMLLFGLTSFDQRLNPRQ